MNPIDGLGLSNLTPNGMVYDPPGSAGHQFPYLMGIELELENVANPYGYTLPGWATHEDQSLRNGIEYVTSNPIAGAAVVGAVNAFYKAEVTSDNSPRTSTHIHVNASDMNVGQLRTMFLLTYVLENALFQVIGEARKFCGYCMPLSEMAPQRIRDVLLADTWNTFYPAFTGRNEDKYYGFNINSIRKHGTVEFRYFYGGPTKAELLSWLSYCTSIKTMSKAMTVDDLLSLPDADSLVAILTPFLGPWAETLVNAQGSTALYESLQEVAALFPDQDKLVREDELVFVSDPLLNLVKVTQFNEDNIPNWEKFAGDARELKVMTTTAWIRMLSLARQGKNLSVGARPPKKLGEYLDDQLFAVAAPDRNAAEEQDNLRRARVREYLANNLPPRPLA